MRDPIRIGFVLHVMQVAGAEVLVAETIRRLGRQIDPVVLCLDAVGQLGERMQAEGVPVISLDRRPGLDLSTARRLAHEIDCHQLDVVHAHQYTPFFYTALARMMARHRVHVMFTEHGRHYPDIVSWKRRLVNRAVLSWCADEINGVCRFSVDGLAHADGFPRHRMEVIPNGIDAARYAAVSRDDARQRVGLPGDRLYVTCVARFHPVKDHRTLLNAFARVAAVVPQAELLLAGDGALRGDLQSQVSALGLDARVRFLGVRDDVADLLRASDVFALLSVSEAASLTLLEAMASELPVVVTAVGGNPEIVDDGVHGLLVPRGDVDAAAAAIVRLLSAPERAAAMGHAARQRVLQHFQLDHTIRSYGARYASAAARLRVRASAEAVA